MDFTKVEHTNFMKYTLLSIVAFCFAVFCVAPLALGKEKGVALEETAEEEEPGTALPDFLFTEAFSTNMSVDDLTLSLLRQPETRASVEWFYIDLVNDRDIALAILDAAEEYDIPVSLAFSVAYAESKYKTDARNVNKNGSIDRGLFQLNNRTFPNLSEKSFYDAKVSAHYGMSHLRFCMDTAGNEVAAIAMYNAGTNKVHNDRTPKTTLDYIYRIQNYRESITRDFEAEVLSSYQTAFRAEKESTLLAKN